MKLAFDFIINFLGLSSTLRRPFFVHVPRFPTTPPAPSDNFVLLEDGTSLLLEDGTEMLLE